MQKCKKGSVEERGILVCVGRNDELTKWIFFLGKVKKCKKQSVEVKGVLLFVGRNDKKDFFLGKVKFWEK